ncbi:cytochrome ubiquinol oxidase subunit I [Nostoc sp.]|uniref:cytochrome ubiquinol oxidase subunit I n=1 Tax=Nostoc sp. TaxID=1180 RepID=UPI003FA57183
MQTPAGGEMVNGKFMVRSYLEAILNPAALNSWFHMILAILETALFVTGGISAWYLLNKRHQAFFSKSFKTAIALAILITPLQIVVGNFRRVSLHHSLPSHNLSGFLFH